MSSEEEILGNATKCKKMETLSRNSLTHDEEAHDEKAEKIVNEVESQDIFRKKVQFCLTVVTEETAAKAAFEKNAMEEAVDKEAAKEEKKAVEIAEYLDYYKKIYEQKAKYNIYCITGESKEVVSASTFVEKLTKR